MEFLLLACLREITTEYKILVSSQRLGNVVSHGDAVNRIKKPAFSALRASGGIVVGSNQMVVFASFCLAFGKIEF